MSSRGKRMVLQAVENVAVKRSCNSQPVIVKNAIVKSAELANLHVLNSSAVDEETSGAQNKIHDSESTKEGDSHENNIFQGVTTDGAIPVSRDAKVIIIEDILLRPAISYTIGHETDEFEKEDEKEDDPFEDSGDEYVPSDAETETEGEEEANDREGEGEEEANDRENQNIYVDENTDQESVNVDNLKQTKSKKIFNLKPKQSRKRIRDETQWKRRKAAISREMGRSYTSQNGKEVSFKTPNIGILCGKNNCRLKCSCKFSEEQRTLIIKNFYKLDINGKNALLFKSITPLPVARQRTNAKKHKQNSYKYNVVVDNKQIIVCKNALCSLYQIGRKKLDIIKTKLRSGSSAPSPDRRGKHTNRPHKMSDEVIECIVSHISKFPSEESHYSRNSNPHKRYLPPTINMSIMYKLFLEECKEQNRPQNFFIKKQSYVNIFNTKFNLSFGHPKSDTCSTCDSGQSSEGHKDNIHAGFHLMQKDRNRALSDSNLCYITVDLQQTMPLPKITTSKAFYLRQLWFYNLGIHMVTTEGQKAIMQTWTEDVAGRGSTEVISGLWHFMQYLGETSPRKHIVVWSDSCAGQNKNFNMICFYQLLILKGIFTTIDHKFPEVGHTYLDSDRDFGRVEKVLRKHETVVTPEQYRNLIRSAISKTSLVNNMEQYFVDVDGLVDKLHLVNKKKNTLNEKVPFRDGIKWIRVNEFGTYFYKECYDEYTPFKQVNIHKNPKVPTTAPKNVELVRVANKTNSITVEKIQNLKTQLPYIPTEHRWFYVQVIEETETKEGFKKQKRKT